MSSVKSVVISCAGIGSRLGLGLTKALVQINGRSLISWQLELFKDVEDIRIVIGFQANDIIEEVRKHRQDVIFIFNHQINIHMVLILSQITLYDVHYVVFKNYYN